MIRRSLPRICLVGVLGSSCGPQIGLGDAEPSGSDGTGSGSTSTAVTTFDVTSGADVTTSAGTISTSSTSSSGPDNTFITPEDVPPTIECDAWTGLPCERGEKCMPYGQSGWNATKCVPIAPDPAGPGEPCTVEDHAASGIDDCEAFSMCWYVDPDTNQGQCVPFCTGSETNPGCDDSCQHCALTGNGVLILCLPTCDPIAQDCPEGQACYGVGNQFLCSQNVSKPDEGRAGDPCENLNMCNPGFFCASAALVPGCQGAAGCCAPFCDMTASDPCPDTSVECVAWWDGGQTPDGCYELDNVGGCVLPW